MRRFFRLVVLIVTCVGCAAREAPAQPPAITDKATALQQLGPPVQVQRLEGDDFWYYVISQQDDWQAAANILQGFSAGSQGRPFTPSGTVRTLILHFDGNSGALKQYHWR